MRTIFCGNKGWFTLFVIQISDSDLDGVGSQVVGKFAYGYSHTPVFVERYDAVDDIVNFTLDNLKDGDKIVITDLSPSEKTIERINKEFADRVSLYDHHKTALKKLEECSWAIVDTSKCAAAIFFDHVKDRINQKHHSYLEGLVELVNDYDLWIRRRPQSERLNVLLQIIGKEEFYELFSSPRSLGETYHEKKMIDMYLGMREQYINNAAMKAEFRVDPLGVKYVHSFADQHINNLADKLHDMFPDASYIRFVDMQNSKVSLRSRGEFDVSKIASSYGGGGHKNAAGFYFSPSDRKYFI